MKFLKKYYNDQNWNIGFLQMTPEELLEKRTLGRISWMKHPFKDRFFADPFILKLTDSDITILVEECEFDKNKGCISELVVDLKTMELLERKIVLELDTHLSYPAIYFEGGHIYVYPENGESGSLNLYEYDPQKRRLFFVKTIINDNLYDSTIYKLKDSSVLFATKWPNTQKDLYLYKSEKYDGNYIELGCSVLGLQNSRPAGNLFSLNEKLYRPAQNCLKRYGSGIEIMEIQQLLNNYSEKKIFSIKPSSFKYNLGLHTINFKDGWCVIDGYGYLYPIRGRLYHFISNIKYNILKFFYDGKSVCTNSNSYIM